MVNGTLDVPPDCEVEDGVDDGRVVVGTVVMFPELVVVGTGDDDDEDQVGTVALPEL